MMDLAGYKQAVDQAYCCDEQPYVDAIRERLLSAGIDLEAVTSHAASLINAARHNAPKHPLHELLQTYDLSQPEGVQLMALAEALLRTNDADSAKALILDKITDGHWQTNHAGKSRWNQASEALLALTSQALKENGAPLHDRLSKMALPVVHRVMRRVVKGVAAQFVFAENIKDALDNIKYHLCGNEHFSLDMLGEAAVTHQDAERFFQNYLTAIDEIAHKQSQLKKEISLSVKLSALYPCYDVFHEQAASKVIGERLLALCKQAALNGIAVTVDAEESERLLLSIDIIEQVIGHSELADYHGLGLAVQAYNKQAMAVLEYLQALAKHHHKRIPVRLVKGAYWDSEIKQAQLQGLASYPVFTQKNHTDLHYLACAHYLLNEASELSPQFATHNAVTLAHILAIAGDKQAFECQRLHGMGEAIYQQLYREHSALTCRVYGPVGDYAELLAYLVRRILENGANNAFVRQLAQTDVPAESLAIHPLAEQADHALMALPEDILGGRKKSRGLHWASVQSRSKILDKVRKARDLSREAAMPLVGFECQIEPPKAVYNPYNGRQMGVYYPLAASELPKALEAAEKAWPQWRGSEVHERATLLENFADALDAEREKFMALLVTEAGKTLPDALEEVREAIDFARYYAELARTTLAKAAVLPGPTGEVNTLLWRARGVYLCISPWNFPLAIFTGQILAALVTGNCVLAKPASQTPLVAYHVIKLLHSLGVPRSVVQYLPVAGSALNNDVLQARQLAGVAFTGSNATANILQQQLVARRHGFIPLIAETGGQNAMIVEATALPEQVVRDVVRSAFFSAGQRCSALRMLYVQESIFDKVIELLAEALYTLNLGDPGHLDTDIGPIIDSSAKKTLQDYLDKKVSAGRVYAKAALPEQCAKSFIAPHIIGVDSILDIDQEYFGPILHIARFRLADVEQVVDDINQCGYGLTFGVHSRNQTFINNICQRVAVGNIYINRNITGAVVGVQPFGGQGLSGTGFKAGGPHYLMRFATEVTISDNVAAIGGNTQLLAGPKSS